MPRPNQYVANDADYNEAMDHLAWLFRTRQLFNAVFDEAEERGRRLVTLTDRHATAMRHDGRLVAVRIPRTPTR